jgi:hypothetical protein
MFRERTPDLRQIGPVYANPTLATRDLDRWLGIANADFGASEAGASVKSNSGRRGRKPGSGMIDDGPALREMLHHLAAGTPSKFAAAGKAAQGVKDSKRDSIQRRLARKFRAEFGSQPPPGKTWRDVEQELNSKSPPQKDSI